MDKNWNLEGKDWPIQICYMMITFVLFKLIYGVNSLECILFCCKAINEHFDNDFLTHTSYLVQET